ncbi:phiSA1p31-related protein [Actinacidiphila oryziradicis]|uniref:phiSA1p31-related protein n=1 Tax=Actinacidiphila oryziradicis TaxID=2571141 RepID=UPI003898E92A
MWDQVYDLAASHQDAQGNHWQYDGDQASDGVPLLSLAGRPEPCRITNVVEQAGPLVALRRAHGPVIRGAAAAVGAVSADSTTGAT